MARALLGLSHAPLVALNAVDAQVEHERHPAIDAARQLARAFAPELIGLVGPDHCNGFSNELMPRLRVGTQAVSSGNCQSPAGPQRALASFAVAKTLNAAISAAQGTEVAVQPVGVGITLTVGQVLDPLNDLVEQFASLMLAAAIAFGVQKVLLAISAHWPVSLVVTVAALA